MRPTTARVNATHALRFTGPINNLHEAPAIGNGDLNALVQVFQNEFRLHLGKNNIWDARFDNRTADWVVTQDNLIRLARDYGFRIENGRRVYDRQPPASLRYKDCNDAKPRVFPSPKVAGMVRVIHSGTSASRVAARLDIATGIVTAEFTIDFGWHGKGLLSIEAFVDRAANAVRLRIRQEGRRTDFRLAVEKLPDGGRSGAPPPEVRRFDDCHGAVTQRFPAEHNARAFAWHLAGSFPGPTGGRALRPLEALPGYPHRLWQACSLRPGQSLELMVGVATTRDAAGDALQRARRLAGEATPEAYDQARRAHVRAWAAFWERSGLELQDKELEKTWYRNLFALACVVSSEAMAPMGCGNVLIDEPRQNSVHSGYTVNMNIQKMFLAALPTGHPEWIASYARWLAAMTPTFRHLAKLIFNLPGIHSPHWLFPFLPPAAQINCNTCGRALGMTGWHGQPLWWRWQYYRERAFLRKIAYPYFKQAACFYWRYLKKYLDASGDLYPSLNLEGPPWTKDFKHNRDCFIDLILFRQTFTWAIRSAEILKTDAAWRKRWQWGRAQIRPIRIAALPDGEYWIYGDKNGGPSPDPEQRRAAGEGQCISAAWLAFPGEYIAGDEPEGDAAKARAIMERHQWWKYHPGMIWIHHWWCAIPALRLGVKRAFSNARAIILRERFPSGLGKTTFDLPMLPDGGRAPEDNYLGVVATTEMLLQSQGEVIRLFPCWPKRKRAAFCGLPARGGFLVAAEWDPKTGLRAEIKSLAGEPCRVRWENPRLPAVTCQGKRVAVKWDGRDIVFATRKGSKFFLQSRDRALGRPASGGACPPPAELARLRRSLPASGGKITSRRGTS